MDWPDARVPAIATGLVAAAVMILVLASHARRSPRAYSTALLTLRSRPASAGFMLALQVLAILITTLILFQARARVLELALLALLAQLAGAWDAVGAYRRRVVIDDAGITDCPPVGRPRLLRWHEIEQVTYSRWWRCLVVHGRGGERIRIKRDVNDYVAATELLQKRLPSHIAAPGLRRGLLVGGG
jgi:hypothetical protein